MKIKTIPLISIVFAGLLLASSSTAFLLGNTKINHPLMLEDFDPLVDLSVTISIKSIRSLEKTDLWIPTVEKIDMIGDPDFYVKVYINDEEFTSPTWKNTKYIYDPQWSATANVPDEIEFVDIRIELWDWSITGDRLCDLTGIDTDEIQEDRGINISYSIKTGHWFGDDQANNMEWGNDYSGYGRANGCDDGSIYQRDRDCELWFDVYQNDYDNDTIPYWTEVNVYETDPMVSNVGEDNDNDSIPIEWEHKWGHYFRWRWQGVEHRWLFTDFEWDDHENIDYEIDGLSNYEEYLTSQWGSDPFCKDLFVEMDIMDAGPDGEEKSVFPEGGKELLRTAFDRQNVVLHLDDGCMGGGETIPFQRYVNDDILEGVYNSYFLHGTQQNWRRGIFHYGVVVYEADFPGYVFNRDAWQISYYPIKCNKSVPIFQQQCDVAFASAYMHECGHTFGFNPIGGHDDNSKYPWQPGWWKWRPYKSCMNYGYTYQLVDYSDGSRGKNDFDDWGPDRLDLTYFQGGFSG